MGYPPEDERYFLEELLRKVKKHIIFRHSINLLLTNLFACIFCNYSKRKKERERSYKDLNLYKIICLL